VRESIQLMQKVFRLRTCDDTVFTNRSRPCLLHQIRRCTAPCVGLVSVADYAEDVRSAELFLSGKEDEVLERLAARMEDASRRMDYEAAAVLRDQINALRKVREKQFIADDSGRDADVVACARVAGVTCVNLVMIRAGHHLGDKNFFPRNAEDASEDQVLEAFVAQHYLRHSIPRQVIIGARLDPAPLEEALCAQAGRRIQINANPIGARRVWLEMACKNARLGAEQAASLHSTQEARLTALQSALELAETPQRIECFDVSHTMGEAPVASCVVYDRASMQKSEYRRFNIAGVQPGDDYGAMREVLSRRYRKLMAGEGRRPDLVLIDGGKGQLGVAREVFSELGLTDVPLVAVAKGEERRAGLEQLFMPGRPEPLVLGGDHLALHLVQQIRDEAHRFAITGHRARRAKARTTSPLQAISGVGAKRRQRLLSRFGGLRGLLAASVEDLAGVEGISRTLAEKIYQELH
jgi:excinuclease ABC subunit C